MVVCGDIGGAERSSSLKSVVDLKYKVEELIVQTPLGTQALQKK